MAFPENLKRLVLVRTGYDSAVVWITLWIPGNLNEAAQVVAKSLRMDDVALAKQMLEKIDWNIAYTQKFRSDMDRIGTFVGIPVEWSKMFDAKFLAQLGPSYVET